MAALDCRRRYRRHRVGARRTLGVVVLASLLRLTNRRPALDTGLRMTTAMFVPLAVGAVLGDASAGLLVGVGAFLVASADNGGPYGRKAATMSAVAVGCSAAALLAASIGSRPLLLIPIVALTLFAAGLAAVIGPAAALGGFIVAIALLVAAAFPGGAPPSLAGQLLLGGLWGMALSLWVWPLQPERPGRQAARPSPAPTEGSRRIWPSPVRSVGFVRWPR